MKYERSTNRLTAACIELSADFYCSYQQIWGRYHNKWQSMSVLRSQHRTSRIVRSQRNFLQTNIAIPVGDWVNNIYFIKQILIVLTRMDKWEKVIGTLRLAIVGSSLSDCTENPAIFAHDYQVSFFWLHEWSAQFHSCENKDCSVTCLII